MFDAVVLLISSKHAAVTSMHFHTPIKFTVARRSPTVTDNCRVFLCVDAMVMKRDSLCFSAFVID